LQGNEFRLTPFKIKRANICTAITNDVYVWPMIVAQSDFTKDCPGYKVKNAKIYQT
jgi:hypothetical protein